MARLNEPPIAPASSVDTLDAVKRRYLRQNRELAKTNSQQSMRIRTLENDASRLLAENLSLREQVLHLQNVMESQPHRPSFDVIESMKNELEMKLQEIGGLVAEFGQLKKKDDERLQSQKQTTATKKAPEERQWRSGLGLQEVENAMLPTINEDKHFPRQTMNADELQDILEARESLSPDIGPPPISRFEDQESMTFNPSTSAEEPVVQPIEDQVPALPVNLETRRKRRESGPRLDVCRVPLFEPPAEQTEKPIVSTIRVGSKRKFSVQEDEDKTRSAAEPFRFNRRNASTQLEDPNSTEDTRPSSPERPVLSSKPVNTDPVLSPKKQRSSLTGKPDKPERRSSSKTSRSRLKVTRDVQPESMPMEIAPPIPVAEITLDELPPKTPALEHIFSPPTTESSTSRIESKDTPPPGDLSNGTSMTARPSRRARPQVSYKEPPLNTKMRRPGKELVDAVNADQASRTSLDSQSFPTSVSKILADQDQDGSSWRPVGAGTSVGRMPEEAGEPGSPLRQKLDRKEGQDLQLSGSESKHDPAAAADLISTPSDETGATTKRRISTSFASASTTSEANNAAVTSKQPVARRDDLAVFEFNESSPVNDEKLVAASNHSRSRLELAKAARSARRHSSVPLSGASEDINAGLSGKMQRSDSGSSTHKRTASGSTRSSSTSSLARSTSVARASAKERDRKSSTVLPPGASGTSKGESDVVGNARAEKAASRRRSMIV